MAGSKTLTVTITGDASNVRRALRGVGDDVDQLDGKANRASSGWSTAMGGMSTAAAAAVSAAGAAVVGFGLLTVRGVQQAADLGESINAVEVMLGEGADSFLEFGQDSANSLGITQAALNQAITPIAAIMKNAGQGGDELSGNLEDLATRATDVASVFNVETTEALDAFGAALRGESEPARRFGVTLDEASVNAKALEMGLGDASGAVDQAGKIQARYALIMEQTSSAAGDFQNTADSLPNTMKRVQASFDEALTSLGAPLLAPLADGLSALVEGFGPLESMLGRAGEAMGTWVDAASTALPVFTTLFEGVLSGAMPVIEAVTDLMGDLADELGPELEPIAQDLGDSVAQLGQSFAELISEAAPLIPLVADVVSILAEAVGAFADAAAAAGRFGHEVLKLNPALAIVDLALGDAGESGGGFADMVTEAAESAGGMEAPVGAAAEALIAQAGAAETAEDKLKAWKEAVDEALGNQLDLTAAASNYQEALDKITESFRENGNTIDIATEAGRNNNAAIREGIDDAVAYAEALAGEGKYQEAQVVLAGVREEITKAGGAANVSRDAMELYLASLGATPEEIETLLTVLGIPENEAALEEVTRDRTTLAMAKHYGAEAVDRYLNVVARDRDAPINARANGIAWVEGQLANLTRPRWVEIHTSIGPAPPGFNNAERTGGGRSVGPAGRSTADLFNQRPVVVQIDGREVGRTPSVYRGITDQAHRDRAAAGVR